MTDDRKKTIERVKVSVRVRPLTDEDLKSSGKDSILEEVDKNSGLITVKGESDRKSFTFDTLFDQTSTQKEIYNRVGKPVVESVLSGYNSTILTYGQTGTGKTFTMIGAKGKQKGIIPRCIKAIFSASHNDSTHTYLIKIGFMQLYMEVLQDLIKPNPSSPILIREDADEGVFLSNLTWIDVSSVSDCMSYLSQGEKNRSIAFTNMNSQSSRSHAVFMVRVEKRIKKDLSIDSPRQARDSDNTMTKSVLYLVDLAGSERVSKTKTSGNRLDEAKNINLSLLALGNVIQALSDGKSKFIPFRDSKLTRILEQSLGGNSKTSMIVTIGPAMSNFSESLSSLLFASRAMKIQNVPKMNVAVDYKALCSKLQAELDKIKDGENISKINDDKLLEENAALKERLEKLGLDHEKLKKVLENSKSGLEVSMLLGDSDECKALKKHYRKKLEIKDEEFKTYRKTVEDLLADKDEKIMGLEARVQELELINNSLSAEFKVFQDELEKERIDKERVLNEIYELREKNFDDQDKLNQEIMRIVGISSAYSAKSGYSSVVLPRRLQPPVMSHKVDVKEIKAKYAISPMPMMDNEAIRCPKCISLRAQVTKCEDIIDILENALIDMTEKCNNEYSSHRESVIMYEREKKEMKKNIAKLIKAYKRLEKKSLEELNKRNMHIEYLSAR